MKEIRERSKKGVGEGKIENSLQFLNSMQAKQMIDRQIARFIKLRNSEFET